LDTSLVGVPLHRCPCDGIAKSIQHSNYQRLFKCSTNRGSLIVAADPLHANRTTGPNDGVEGDLRPIQPDDPGCHLLGPTYATQRPPSLGFPFFVGLVDFRIYFGTDPLGDYLEGHPLLGDGLPPAVNYPDNKGPGKRLPGGTVLAVPVNQLEADRPGFTGQRQIIPAALNQQEECAERHNQATKTTEELLHESRSCLMNVKAARYLSLSCGWLYRYGVHHRHQDEAQPRISNITGRE
jgi:hypothetical protein